MIPVAEAVASHVQTIIKNLLTVSIEIDGGFLCSEGVWLNEGGHTMGLLLNAVSECL